MTMNKKHTFLLSVFIACTSMAMEHYRALDDKLEMALVGEEREQKSIDAVLNDFHGEHYRTVLRAMRVGAIMTSANLRKKLSPEEMTNAIIQSIQKKIKYYCKQHWVLDAGQLKESFQRMYIGLAGDAITIGAQAIENNFVSRDRGQVAIVEKKNAERTLSVWQQIFPQDIPDNVCTILAGDLSHDNKKKKYTSDETPEARAFVQALKESNCTGLFIGNNFSTWWLKKEVAKKFDEQVANMRWLEGKVLLVSVANPKDERKPIVSHAFACEPLKPIKRIAITNFMKGWMASENLDDIEISKDCYYRENLRVRITPSKIVIENQPTIPEIAQYICANEFMRKNK